MSDHEPSYYEIALTNRQVMVAFVILLVCLMGTFFAGVWVGGGDAPARAEAATPADEMAAAKAQDVETLDFFGGGGEVAAPAEDRVETRYEERRDGGASPVREDPAVQRNRREARRAAAAAGDTGEDDTSGGEGPALSADAPRVQPGADEPEATPRRTGMEPARETEPPTTSRPVSRDDEGSGPVIQVFSSREREQAQKVVDRLTGTGQPAYLLPQEVDGNTMYRVRIGPFDDRGQAEQVAAQVRRVHKLDTWITQ